MSDESVIKHLEPQVRETKLSEAIRAAGYTNPCNYRECVIGRAYTHVTGRRLPGSLGIGKNASHRAAATFGVPVEVVVQCEIKCHERVPAEQIADWLESQGL